MYCLYLGIGDGSSDSLRLRECDQFVVFTCKQGKNATNRDSVVAPQDILLGGFDEVKLPPLPHIKGGKRRMKKCYKQ